MPYETDILFLASERHKRMPDEAIIEIPQPLGLYGRELYRRADEYVTAFEILTESSDTELAYPRYYLLTHAIELYLKSFLAAHEVTKLDLQHKYKHQLKRSWKKCRALGLKEVPNLPELVKRMDLMNRHQDFRYPSGYNLQLPYASECMAVISQLQEAIKNPVMSAGLKAEIRFHGEYRTYQKVRWAD